jgi:raffinose/stachyose/melibiose transport system permease protein
VSVATGQTAAVGAPARVREAPTRVRRASAIAPYLYVLPAFLLFATFVLAPFAHTVWLSFFEWDGVTIGTWVGLANYEEMFQEGVVRSSFVHTLVLIGFFAVLPIAAGLVLATALSRAPVRGMTAFRTIIFLPQVVSMVAVAVIWRWLYTEDGPINSALRSVGLDAIARGWLGDYTWALPAIGLVGAWALIGLVMVLFLAGMQQIPGSLYDAARVDGAGPIREFFSVTLPGLRGVIAVATTLTVVGALRSFDVVFVMTRGGPGTSTQVPGLQIYNRAFQTGQVGSACAIAVVLAILVFAVTVGINRYAERAEAER